MPSTPNMELVFSEDQCFSLYVSLVESDLKENIPGVFYDGL